MEHANDSEPVELSSLHHSVMATIGDLTPSVLQAIYFEIIERGPESLLEPIEAEFEKRGLDRYAEYPETVVGI